MRSISLAGVKGCVLREEGGRGAASGQLFGMARNKQVSHGSGWHWNAAGLEPSFRYPTKRAVCQQADFNDGADEEWTTSWSQGA